MSDRAKVQPDTLARLPDTLARATAELCPSGVDSQKSMSDSKLSSSASSNTSSATNKSGLSKSESGSAPTVTNGEKPQWPAYFLRPTSGFPALRRSYSAIYLASAFAIPALMSWIITCILTFRPFNASSYAERIPVAAYYTQWQNPEKWYRAMLVLDAIVDLLTLPVTSAVCIDAALAYTQKKKNNISAAQTVLLADKSWSSFDTFFKLLLGKKKFRDKTTPFFYFALLLNVIGFAIAPLKGVFIGHRTVPIPKVGAQTPLLHVTDVPDLIGPPAQGATEVLLSTVRGRLGSYPISIPQPNLWYERSKDLPCYDCLGDRGTALSDMLYLKNWFVSQVPPFYSTGFYKQFAPRVSSVLEVEHLENTDLPPECYRNIGRFYKSFSPPEYPFSLTACMPGPNLHLSPFVKTRDRQDVMETLYLQHTRLTDKHRVLVRFDVKTTVGYFELPSYQNDNFSVIDKAPKPLVTSSGEQTNGYGYYIGLGPHRPPDKPFDTLEHVRSKGPLLMIALAAFGDDSYVSTARSNSPPGSAQDILRSPFALTYKADETLWQLHHEPKGIAHIMNLLGDKAIARLEMEVALFIANEAWLLEGTGPGSYGNLIVSGDLGIDAIIPNISVAGVAVISTLLLLYLSGLFALAMYAAHSRRWTPALDSLTMMRLGAAAGDQLPSCLGVEPDELHFVGDPPDWVHNAEQEATAWGIRRRNERSVVPAAEDME